MPGPSLQRLKEDLGALTAWAARRGAVDTSLFAGDEQIEAFRGRPD